MNKIEYDQLNLAMRLLRNHCCVDYNNDLYIRTAQQWFDETLDAIFNSKALPPRPQGFPSSPM